MDTDVLKPSAVDFRLADQWLKSTEEEKRACSRRKMYEDALRRVEAWKMARKVFASLGRNDGDSAPSTGTEKIFERDVIRVASKDVGVISTLNGAAGNVVENVVCHHYGITIEELRGRCRSRRYIPARHTVFWILHREFGWSLNRVGMRLNRDHSSVLHGVRSMDRLPGHDKVKMTAIGLRHRCLDIIRQGKEK